MSDYILAPEYGAYASWGQMVQKDDQPNSQGSRSKDGPAGSAALTQPFSGICFIYLCQKKIIYITNTRHERGDITTDPTLIGIKYKQPPCL